MFRLISVTLSKSIFGPRSAGHVRFLTSVSNENQGSSSSSDSDSSDGEDAGQAAATETKALILKSALPFVPQYGWTKQSLALGAEKAGLPGVSHGLFERGEVELVEFFYRSANEQLRGVLAQKCAENKPTDVFLHDAVSTRLRMLIPYIGSWPEAMAMMSAPSNVPYSIANLTELVDDIWYYAGDRSTTFEWYTKRAALAAIYGTAQFYMIQDNSPDYNNTWAFLNRQLSLAKQAAECSSQCQSLSGTAGNLLWGAFNVGRNILSLNDRQR